MSSRKKMKMMKPVKIFPHVLLRYSSMLSMLCGCTTSRCPRALIRRTPPAARLIGRVDLPRIKVNHTCCYWAAGQRTTGTMVLHVNGPAHLVGATRAAVFALKVKVDPCQPNFLPDDR